MRQSKLSIEHSNRRDTIIVWFEIVRFEFGAIFNPVSIARRLQVNFLIG